MMSDSYKEIEQRTRRYWYVDGLAELFIGLLLLVVGLLVLAPDLLPPGSWQRLIAVASLVVIIVGGAQLGGRLVRAVKTHLTYPRTGYVNYRKPSRQRRLRNFLIMIPIAALWTALILILGNALIAWVPLIDGLVLGAILWIAGRGLLRFYLLAGLSMIVGGILAYLQIGGILGQMVFNSIMGLSLAVSGAITLIHYLRQTSVPEDGVHGE
ncbi:MAG: hypothetical protein P8Z00_02515 [Anaerolineales bacterium]|jgi:hypothetical protein